MAVGEERKHSFATMKRNLCDLNTKRKSMAEYKTYKKQDLIKTLSSLFANLDRIRHSYVEVQLENNYLNRKVKLLDEQIEFYSSSITKRNFKHGISTKYKGRKRP